MEDLAYRQVVLDCTQHNLLIDINKFLHRLQRLTTKFENQDLDQCIVYVEPSRLVQLLIMTFYQIDQNQLLFDSLTPNSLTSLAFNCEQIIKEYSKVLHKKNKLVISLFYEQIEHFIFSKELYKYKNWEDLQETLINKSSHIQIEEELDQNQSSDFLQNLYSKLCEKYSEVKINEKYLDFVIKNNLLQLTTIAQLIFNLESEQTQVEYLIKLLRNSDDIQEYELQDLARTIYSYLNKISIDVILSNGDLINLLNKKFLMHKLVKDPPKELKDLIYSYKLSYIKQEKDIAIQETQNFFNQELNQQQMESLNDNIMSYYNSAIDVANEMNAKVTKSIKRLQKSLQGIQAKIEIQKIGHLLFQNLYILEQPYTFDILLISDQDPEVLKDQILFALQHCNAKIKPRIGNYSKLPLINYKYHYLICADPNYEHDYTIRIIIDHQNSAIYENNKQLQEMIAYDENLKVLCCIINSWIKHYLYDPAIKFETFSQFEVSIILKLFINNISKIQGDTQDPQSFQELSDGQLFIKFLKFLLHDLNPQTNEIDGSMIKDHQQALLQVDYENTFYQLKSQDGFPIYQRKVQRDYYDALSLFSSVIKTINLIEEGKYIFE